MLSIAGLLYDDQEVQQKKKIWPFNIRRGQDDKPLICVKVDGEDKNFTPEEIISIILKKIIEYSDSHLN